MLSLGKALPLVCGDSWCLHIGFTTSKLVLFSFLVSQNVFCLVYKDAVICKWILFFPFQSTCLFFNSLLCGRRELVAGWELQSSGEQGWVVGLFLARSRLQRKRCGWALHTLTGGGLVDTFIKVRSSFFFYIWMDIDFCQMLFLRLKNILTDAFSFSGLVEWIGLFFLYQTILAFFGDTQLGQDNFDLFLLCVWDLGEMEIMSAIIIIFVLCTLCLIMALRPLSV